MNKIDQKKQEILKEFEECIDVVLEDREYFPALTFRQWFINALSEIEQVTKESMINRFKQLEKDCEAFNYEPNYKGFIENLEDELKSAEKKKE